MSDRVLILGRGRSGSAAAELLESLGRRSVVLDADAAFPEGDFGCAVVSPGIALSHPWQVECRRRGIALVSELQLGCEELRRRGWRLLAVTGSKGKSSVAKVVSEAIGLTGRKAVACGNYGLPVCRLALEESPGWAVVEVSSFQMETTDLRPGTFEAAAVVNLQADHLDRHRSLEEYHRLKRRLLDMAKVRIEPGCADFPRELFAGTYFDNEVLSGNAVCAVGLMKAAGAGDGDIRRAFAGFSPLPHRMCLVAEKNGVRFIDDSKATSLAAMTAALKMAGGGVRLVAGGLSKGDDPSSAIVDLTKRVKKVYLIGRCAGEFYGAWSACVDCEICENLERAVSRIKCEMQAGETVLLSPGCASFDQFVNFGQRGDIFAALVNKEG